MKKISYLLSLCGLMCFSASMAQDIEVSGTDPVDLGMIKDNSEFNIQVTTVFNDPVSSPVVTLWYAFGTDAFTEGFTGTLGGNIPADLQLNLWQPVTAVGAPGDTVDFTVVVTIENDKDATNDTLTRRFVLAEAAGRDLEISITEPEDGTSVKTWTDLPMVVQLKNTGSETFPSGTPVIYQLSLNGGPQGDANFFNYGGDALEPGDSVALPLTLGIARNAQTGSSDFCFNASWGVQQGQQLVVTEHVRDNNTGCFNVEIEPNSINESVLTINSFFFANNAVNLSFSNVDVKESLRCEVIDLNGRVLVSQNLPEISKGTVANHSVMMPQVQQGAYILNIYDGDLPVATQKFMAY